MSTTESASLDLARSIGRLVESTELLHQEVKGNVSSLLFAVGLCLWVTSASALTLDEKIQAAGEEFRSLVCTFKEVANDPNSTAQEDNLAVVRLRAGEAEIVKKYGRAIAQAGAMLIASEGEAVCQDESEE